MVDSGVESAQGFSSFADCSKSGSTPFDDKVQGWMAVAETKLPNASRK